MKGCQCIPLEGDYKNFSTGVYTHADAHTSSVDVPWSPATHVIRRCSVVPPATHTRHAVDVRGPPSHTHTSCCRCSVVPPVTHVIRRCSVVPPATHTRHAVDVPWSPQPHTTATHPQPYPLWLPTRLDLRLPTHFLLVSYSSLSRNEAPY